MATMEAALEQCQSVLNQLLESGPKQHVDSPVLRDFKLCIDGLRLTLWALIQAQEEGYLERQGGDMDLDAKLLEFRIKRTVQMLEELQEDLNGGRLSADMPDVGMLSTTLRKTLDGVGRLDS